MNDTKQQHIDKLMGRASYVYLEWLAKNFKNRVYVKRHLPMHVYTNTEEFKEECYVSSQDFVKWR